MVQSRRQIVTGLPDPAAVILDATRRLLWIETPAEARKIACDVVAALGGSIVEAELADVAALPVDLSFGDGKPILPTATPATPAYKHSKSSCHRLSSMSAAR